MNLSLCADCMALCGLSLVGSTVQKHDSVSGSSLLASRGPQLCALLNVCALFAVACATFRKPQSDHGLNAPRR
jgi:hypothetical protein